MSNTPLRVLALVTDAFGGHGGIAQFNRDFLRSLAGCGRDLIVLPRVGTAALNQLPCGVHQLPPVKGRLAYSAAALRIVTSRRFDVLFCGHLFMAPLAAALAKLVGLPLWVQVHGIEAWQNLSLLHRRSLEAATLVTSV